MQYRWDKNYKLLDNDYLISKGAKSSKKRNLGKDKRVICHNKWHFEKECPKSRKANSATESSEEMDTQFPTEDEPLRHNIDNIPESICNTNTGISKDILSLFIYG